MSSLWSGSAWPPAKAHAADIHLACPGSPTGRIHWRLNAKGTLWEAPCPDCCKPMHVAHLAYRVIAIKCLQCLKWWPAP